MRVARIKDRKNVKGFFEATKICYRYMNKMMMMPSLVEWGKIRNSSILHLIICEGAGIGMA